MKQFINYFIADKTFHLNLSLEVELEENFHASDHQ